jgi:DNA primase
MITIKEKIKLIHSCLGKSKMSNDGNNVNVVCPICEQNNTTVPTKKKLSINLEKGIYHCWVCESKGSNVGRLCLNFSSNRDSAQTLNTMFKKHNEKEVVSEKPKNKPKLPKDFKLVYNLDNNRKFKKHFHYLEKRGFDKIKMKKFRIGVSSEYPFTNRVIFPSFDLNQNLNYYISRSIDPKEKIRYRNFNGKRKDVIFRQIDVDFNKHLILTEGVFDLVNCPTNSTCVLGSWISEEYYLFKQIVKHKTPVTLCFDPDAKEKTFKIAKKLYEYCVDVKITQNKHRDFGDMTQKEVSNHILTAKPYDNAIRITYLLSEISSGSMF